MFSQLETLAPRLQRILLGMAALLMLFHVFVYVYYSVSLIPFPFDYDQGEGFELVDTLYMSEGKLPYRDNEVFPFYASNYPPIYHVVLIPFAWVFGADYWYGRLVAFLGTWVTVAAIGWAIYREGKRRDVAILMGMAFLASNYIYHIGPLLRQHYFMVMFETLAVVTLAPLFTDKTERQQRNRLLLGMFWLLMAGYTKQLAAFTVIAVFVWLFIRHPRRAIAWGFGFAGVTLAIFAALNLATDGQWWLNAVAANVNEYIPSQFAGLVQQFLRLHWTLLLMAGLMLIYEIYVDRLSLYSVWMVIGLLSTLGAGTWGSGNSYFATSLVAITILAGLFISRTLNQSWQFQPNFYTELLAKRANRFLQKPTQLYAVMGILCWGLMVIYGLTVVKIPTNGIFEGPTEALGIEPKPGWRYPLYDAAGHISGYATLGHIPSQADYDAGWLIVERIQAVDAPVMSEEAGFSMQAGREVITNPTQLRNLYLNDLLDPSELVAMIEDHGFGMLIFRARFYPQPVLDAVDDAYEPREVIRMNGFDYELWYPEPTWELRQSIRDYLSTPAESEFRVQVPASIDDVSQWLVGAMAQWQWLPELSLEPDTDSDCSERYFLKDEQRVLVEICQNDIRIERLISTE